MGKEDIFIKAIRYASSRFDDIVTVQDIANHLSKESGKKLTPNNHIVIHIYEQIMNIQGGEILKGNAYGYLKADAYFHLIEYDMMKSANNLALKALNRSTISIWIAIAALLIGALIGIIY